MKKRFVYMSLILLGIILAACGSAPVLQRSFDAGMPAAGAVESVAYEMEESFGGEFDPSMANEPPSERLVIRNASLVIVVEDPSASASSISQLAEQMGGFVVSSTSINQHTGKAYAPRTLQSQSASQQTI